MAPSERMMTHQSRLLAAEASRLAQENDLQSAECLGLYCVLEVCHHDDETAKILMREPSALVRIFENEIRPTRALERMPVVEAFWSAKTVDGRGPVRIFCQTRSAEESAMEQARLDLSEGLCDVAMILSVQLDPEKVSGKVLRK